MGFRVSALGFRGLGVWGVRGQGSGEGGSQGLGLAFTKVSAERKSSSRTRV